MQLPCAVAVALLPIVSGCYASVGPTVGVDLKTGRATLGLEASGESFTLAHSVALGTHAIARPATDTPSKADSKDWLTHTYLLWEPGFGGVLNETTSENFAFLGAGASVGMRMNRYDDKPLDTNFVMGAWTSAGSALSARASRECGAKDTRPFVAFVVGVRGFELYASPKIGVMDLPSFCFDIFDEGETF
jgi:hypothetical protein